MEKKHWVEELFSPRFSAQDFFQESFEPDMLTSEKRAKEKAKRVEGIYHAALSRYQEEEKQKRKAFLSKMIIRDYDSNVQNLPTTAQTVTCESCQKLNNDYKTAVNSKEDCIWDENELSLLREEMKKKHFEGARWKLQFEACKLEISELTAKQKETERELEAMRMSLAESKRMNECKSVLLKQLQKDGEKKDATVQALRKELHGKCVMLSSLTKSLSKSRGDIQDLQLQNQDLEQELNILKQQLEFKNTIAIDKVRIEYDVQINKLLREIETLKKIASKRHPHSRDAIALD